MDHAALRILDANLNRAGEGLRVLEEYARFILNDARLSLRAKQARHELADIVKSIGIDATLAARDIHGDVGAGLTTPQEAARSHSADVARAAAKRVAESLRCIEEYGKLLGDCMSGDRQAPACHSPGKAGALPSPTLHSPGEPGDSRSEPARNVAVRAETLRYELYALEQEIFLGGPRRARLRRARLHVILTEELCKGPWETICQAALHGGADAIQLREKHISDRDMLYRARRLRDIARSHGAFLIINDRADLAVLADADGVHLGLEDLSPADARNIVGPHRLVGVTAHSVEEAVEAIRQGADYLGVGPMFASPTKPNVPVRGPSLLAEIAAALVAAGLRPGRDNVAPGLRPSGAAESFPSRAPLVAIGGITTENVAALKSPADCPALQIAVCQSVIAAPDPQAAARLLRSRLAALSDRS